MKPTEAKEWIDEAVSLGANRTRATELLDAYTTQLGPILTPIACAATMALLKSMRADEPGVSVAEPPPVEIPRRVVYRASGSLGVITAKTTDAGRPAIEVQIGKNKAVFLKSDREIIYVNDTKAEQARLLLEKLSREAWEGLDEVQRHTAGDFPNWFICCNGDIEDLSGFATPFGVVQFPTLSTAESARDAIIRAGLAWWEEGE